MFIGKVSYREINGTKTAIAEEPIKKCSVVCSIRDGRVRKKRGRFTIQIDENKHIEGPGTLMHACNPNCYWDLKELKLVARRDIRKGEPITFNYCTTEYTLVKDFTCRCGSRNCFGNVRGFSYLTDAQKKHIASITSPYLKSMKS
jgi:uncharacterized protein